jgi:hypothetical protein
MKTEREVGRKRELSEKGMLDEEEEWVTHRSHRSRGTTENDEEKEDIRKIKRKPKKLWTYPVWD